MNGLAVREQEMANYISIDFLTNDFGSEPFHFGW